MDIKKILKDTAVLLVITVVSGLLLGLAYEITAPVIAANQEEEKAASYRGVFTDAASFASREDLLEQAAGVMADNGITNVSVTDVMEEQDASGAVIGYALSLSTNGYGGELVIAYGYGVDGTSMGIDILVSSESSGLGSRASEPEFKDQFAGKAVDSFSYVRSGASADNEINAITGATVTTEAVTNAVNAGIIFGRYCAQNG